MKKLTLEEFITKARKIHGWKYDYSKVIYIDVWTKIIIICPIHGEFEQKPNKHLSGQGCYKCCKTKKLTLEEFIQKAKKVHNDRYGYKNFIYKGNKIKGWITCYDHDDFEQTPNDHLASKGCPRCAGNIQYDTKTFIEKAINIHGDRYDYSKFIYVNSWTKGIIICRKENHGEFEQIPGNHLSGVGCPICNLSKGELAIKDILDKYNIKYTHQYRIPDQKYIFFYDLYLPDYNLLIEFHGKQHYEYTPHFHRNEDRFLANKYIDDIKVELARMLRYKFLEFNYKQLKELSKEQFEDMVIRKINKFIVGKKD